LIIQRDAGVSDETWNKLQAAIQAAKDEEMRKEERDARAEKAIQKAKETGETGPEESGEGLARQEQRGGNQAKQNAKEIERLKRQQETSDGKRSKRSGARKDHSGFASKARKQAEEKQRYQKAMEKIRRMGLRAGYTWHKVQEVTSVEEAQHHLSDSQLGI